MKKILSISLLIISFNTLYSQKKDTIPSIPKRYVFVLDSAGFNTVDSILKLSLQNCGYALIAKDADGLRQGLSAVISFFQREKQLQDANPKTK